MRCNFHHEAHEGREVRKRFIVFSPLALRVLVLFVVLSSPGLEQRIPDKVRIE